MGSYTLNFLLLYIICGFTVAYLMIYAFKKTLLGGTWAALGVAVSGSFLGALVGSFFFGDLLALIPLLCSTLFSWGLLVIYQKIHLKKRS